MLRVSAAILGSLLAAYATAALGVGPQQAPLATATTPTPHKHKVKPQKDEHVVWHGISGLFSPAGEEKTSLLSALSPSSGKNDVLTRADKSPILVQPACRSCLFSDSLNSQDLSGPGSYKMLVYLDSPKSTFWSLGETPDPDILHLPRPGVLGSIDNQPMMMIGQRIPFN